MFFTKYTTVLYIPSLTQVGFKKNQYYFYHVKYIYIYDF